MVIIKRYPNRKLYDTEAKKYIRLDGIAEIIREGKEVQVIDHASGEDLTALTLTQIILEQEKKEGGILSHSVLTTLIRTGSDRLSAIQRNLASSISTWRQFDEEIKQRIQALVRQGEISAAEGKSLLEKLVRQGIQQREERHKGDAISLLSPEALEEYLQNMDIPTRDDLHRLDEQLDELSARLDDAPQHKS